MLFNSTIRQRTGTCCKCGATDIPVAKVGKEIIGINCCHKPAKMQQYSKKALQNKVRKYASDAKAKPKKEVFSTGKKNLEDSLDTEFSRYIRLLYANQFGIVQCYTCDYRGKWINGGIECGHYVSRGNEATRWYARNCRPQCIECNRHKRGNLKVFAERLEEEEQGLVQQLNELKHTISSITNDEMKQMLVDLRAKNRVLINKTIK